MEHLSLERLAQVWIIGDVGDVMNLSFIDESRGFPAPDALFQTDLQLWVLDACIKFMPLTSAKTIVQQNRLRHSCNVAERI